MNAQLVCRPNQETSSCATKQKKPVRLVKGRSYGERNSGLELAPLSRSVGSTNAEVIITWREVGIVRLLAVAGVLPVSVLPPKHVLIDDAIRRFQVYTYVIELQILESA